MRKPELRLQIIGEIILTEHNTYPYGDSKFDIPDLQLAFERRRFDFLKEIIADCKSRQAEGKTDERVRPLQRDLEATAARISQFGRSKSYGGSGVPH